MIIGAEDNCVRVQSKNHTKLQSESEASIAKLCRTGFQTLISSQIDPDQFGHLILRQTHGLLQCLDAAGLNYILNGDTNRIPGSLSLSFLHADGEMLLHRLDLMGTAIATGSACNSREHELSHVIQAIRVPAEYANGTIRITFGMDNNPGQAIALAQQIISVFSPKESS